MFSFNWLNLLAALPSVIQAVQFIHHGEPGATKKQKAMQILQLSEAVVTSANPQLGQTITAFGNIIDQIVNLAHANNAPGFGSNSPPPTTK